MAYSLRVDVSNAFFPCSVLCFFFQAEDGIRDAQESRGLGDVYKRQLCMRDFIEAIRNRTEFPIDVYDAATWSIITALTEESVMNRSLSLIHI